MKLLGDFALLCSNKDVASNWYPSVFSVDGQQYGSAEQFMMHAKAILFGDLDTARAILAASEPLVIWALGRKVSGYDEAKWRESAEALLLPGLLAKFEQNPAMAAELLATGRRTIVETSPWDNHWGAGISSTDARVCIPAEWPGKNRMGALLEQVRAALLRKAASRSAAD